MLMDLPNFDDVFGCRGDEKFLEMLFRSTLLNSRVNQCRLLLLKIGAETVHN